MAAVIGLAAVQGVSALSSSKATKKEAKRAEALERLMTAEELRRLAIEQEQVLGSAKSQIAASGFTGYGASTEAYMENLRGEQGKQRAFTAQTGASRADAIRRSGGARASAYEMEALGSAFKAYGATGEAFNWGLDK
jgi:hypothetical protein